MASKFDKMQEEMSRLVDGTESYESFKEQVIQDYRKCVKDGYLKNVREYKETHLRKGLIVFFCLDYLQLYVMASSICAELVAYDVDEAHERVCIVMASDGRRVNRSCRARLH